jgi:membrane-bound lytic murein transglycosylase A
MPVLENLGFDSKSRVAIFHADDVGMCHGANAAFEELARLGAIKGAGRVDIFGGSGTYAELAAGHLKHDGDLYILIKKP